MVFLLALAGAVPENPPLPGEAKGSPTETQGQQTFQRHYTAAAYITLLSVTIFSRSGVGFGFAGADSRTHGAQRSLNLRFLSGSIPERAHGLNRFGFIQESVKQENGMTVAADYFGLMTASAEESLSDAKAALDSKTGERTAFVAVRGTVGQEKTVYSVRNVLLPSSYGGSTADQLLERVEAELSPPLAQVENNESANGHATGTFLNSLREAILSAESTYRNRIGFNGKTFEFHASKRLDARTGSALRHAGLTTLPDAIVELTGVLRNEKTNEATTFHLWFEQGAANFLPLRFEFKAKSYLRLVFDEKPPLPAETLTFNRELPK
jgi:hypothetical protein